MDRNIILLVRSNQYKAKMILRSIKGETIRLNKEIVGKFLGGK